MCRNLSKISGVVAAVALTMCVITGCKEKKPSFNDPVIERADIIYDAGPGLVPWVVRALNGDLIAGWTSQGDIVPGQTSTFAQSSDLGKTWSEPFITFKSDNPLVGVSVMLYRLPDGNWQSGRMLCHTCEALWTGNPADPNANFSALAGGRKFDSYYSFTDDNGRTFTEKKLLSDPVKRDDFAQGPITELPNGDLLWPWGNWGSEPLNGFKRSTDGGRTWGPTVRAWQDPPPGQDKPLAFNETALAVCKDGSLIAVARVDSLPDKKFWQIRSHDNGKTWTLPVQIEIAGGSPALYCTPKGQLWLAYRDGGLGPGLGMAASDDNGSTWRFLYHLKEPKGEHEKLYGHIRYTDEDRKKPWRPAEGMVGYPCFVKLSDDMVYVVYHAHNRGEMTKKFPAVPFYVAANLLRIPQ